MKAATACYVQSSGCQKFCMPGDCSAQACRGTVPFRLFLSWERKTQMQWPERRNLPFWPQWNNSEEAWHIADKFNHVKEKVVRKDRNLRISCLNCIHTFVNIKFANTEFLVSGNKIIPTDGTPFRIQGNETQVVFSWCQVRALSRISCILGQDLMPQGCWMLWAWVPSSPC